MTENAKVSRIGVKDIVTKRVGVPAVVGMFYAMCCAGAFGIEEMIPETGPGLAIVMLVALPFVWALPYSYILAELGSARPVEGGNIVWVKEALGEFWFGVMVFVNFLWGLVANTVYVVLAVSYFGTIVEIDSLQAYVMKVGLILIFFIINLLGIKEVGAVNTIFSVFVMAAFLIVAIVGFANWHSNPMEPFMSEAYDGAVFPTLGAGLAIGLWMYSGFDEISLVAGEIRDSHRIIPRALMIVIPLMIATYILPTLGGLASVGNWELWTTDPEGLGYHSVLQNFAPMGFTVFFIIVAVLGQCSIFNMCIAVAARASLILSDEHFGPKSLAKLTSKRGTPWVSLLVVVAVTTALLGTPSKQSDFTFLVVLDVFFSVIVCGLTVISAYILKRRIPDSEVPFKAPGGRPMHNIMVGLCLFFCVAMLLLSGTDYFVGGLILILMIPVLYCICKRVWKGASVKDPESHLIDPRTKLGFGDVTRIGGYFVGFGAFGVAGRFFLAWHEGAWGPGYAVRPEDLGEWEADVLADLPELSAALTRQNGLTDGSVWIPGYYEAEYETGFFANWDGMLATILWIGLAAIAAGVALLLIGKRLSADDARFRAQAQAEARQAAQAAKRTTNG
ncbi:MAG: APC family permease [Clostridiales Family XIII bacterium]|jgi:amino acid transporter|nr:APC family permease [Clostridiales Family XIII bacterium]